MWKAFVGGEVEIAAAQDRELEHTRLSQFGGSFKPFFSVRPSEDTRGELNSPAVVGEQLAAGGESEELADAHLSRRHETLRPSVFVRKTMSEFRFPRDVVRQLNFLSADEKQAVTGEFEGLDDAHVSQSAAALSRPSFFVKPSRSGSKVPRDVPRKLDFSSLSGEQNPTAGQEGLELAVLQVETPEGSSLLAEPMNATLASPSRLENSVESVKYSLESGESVGQPGELTPHAFHKSVSDYPCSFQFPQTPESSLSKDPFLGTGGVQSSLFPFSLRPCCAATCRGAADESSSPCPSVPSDASPGTPYQPSPFAGYSQHFVSKPSASTPLDAPTSQAQVKPTFSTPVRPKPVARHLGFGTPAPAQVVQKSSPGHLCTADESAAESGTAAKQGVRSIEPATPARCAYVLEQAESSGHVRSLRGAPCGCAAIKPMGCCVATLAACDSAAPSCCTPKVIGKAGALVQSDDGSPAANPFTPQHHHTPKRSRMNADSYLYQENFEGQGSGGTFPSPSKRPHGALTEQVQVGMQDRV